MGMGGSSGINLLSLSIGVTVEYTKEFLRFDADKYSPITAFGVDTSKWRALSRELSSQKEQPGETDGYP